VTFSIYPNIKSIKLLIKSKDKSKHQDSILARAVSMLIILVLNIKLSALIFTPISKDSKLRLIPVAKRIVKPFR
jgi:hypothetical protein